MTGPVLACEDLSIRYGDGPWVVRNAGFAIMPGECVALVGPSGSGKTTIARAILGLLPAGAAATGRLAFGTENLLGRREADYRALRGRRIGYVAQDPYQACDPLRPVYDHVADAWRAHSEEAPPGVVADGLSAAGIADAARAMWQYPHQWSGGMLQRASIQAAIAHRPDLLIADEPTSALDADRADQTLAALRGAGSAILLISHDMTLVMRHADRIAVCAEGRIVEFGTRAALKASRLAATRELIAAASTPAGRPAAPDAPVLLAAGGITKGFEHKSHHARVLCGVDLTVRAGEIVGVIGPSGCGKSTLLRILAGLERPDGGMMERMAGLARPGAVMPIFQDPVGSLDARWPIWRSLTEPMTVGATRWMGKGERRERALLLLARLGLGHVDLDSVPAELSSGQCQRISVARALAARPRLILADEPTSALDTVARRQVLDMLRAAADAGAGIVLVSHDGEMLSGFASRVMRLPGGGGAAGTARAA